ncbi:MAG: phosphatidylglycerol lysyltransferase domain-containing protein [Clostridia bacterium]
MEFGFKQLELSDKKTFDRYFRFYQPLAGELTFVNLHMWDCVYHSSFLEFEGFLCIVCGEPNARFSLMPIDGVGGDQAARLAKVVGMLLAYFKEIGQNLVFQRVTEQESNAIEQAAAAINCKVEAVFDRDNSDYVYRYEEISGLPGKKYHAKRNHIQNLIYNESPEYVSLTPELLPACIKILEHWHMDRQDDLAMQHEKLSQLILIENFAAYGSCKGGLVKVNGIPKAYTIGQMLNETTLVVHSERADGSIRGLYPYVNQQFLLHEWPGIQYVNREQDCGSEGLRKAKLSYHPNHLENKYKVSLIP